MFGPLDLYSLESILIVVYFDQLLGAACTPKADWNLFFSRFSTYYFWINRMRWEECAYVNWPPMILTWVIRIKSLKTAEKNSSTSFWVCATLKSWSKYTTIPLSSYLHYDQPKPVREWKILATFEWKIQCRPFNIQDSCLIAYCTS